MSAESEAGSEPMRVYAERVRERRAQLVPLEARDTLISNLRVAVFLVFVAMGITTWQAWIPLWSLALPVAGFLALLVAHDRVSRRRARVERGLAHYLEGVARLEGDWAGKGIGDSDYAVLEGEHPFAGDLDLFGEGSLFELLCRARTRGGEETLARWLSPGIAAGERVTLPTADELQARQRAVESLRGAVDLREAIAVSGGAGRVEVHPGALDAWGRGPVAFSPRQQRWLPILGVVLPVVAIAGVVVWAVGLGPWLMCAGLLAEGLTYRVTREATAQVAGPALRQGAELAIMVELLVLLEQGTFDDPTVCALQAEVGASEARTGASWAIAELRRLLGWYEAQHNGVFFPIALLLMWGPNFALAIERWRAIQGPRIGGWTEALGRFEALLSLANYAYENPGDPFPEIVEAGGEAGGEASGEAGGAGQVLVGERLGHPLLPRASCVRNDIDLAAPTRAYVISGSNMSGKSTFLRTVGTNVVLGLAGAPVRADSLRMSPLRIGATLRIQDSLREGASRFWAELTRLRTVSELADAGPTLFLLDEILHGTNSHDRQIGAEALLRSLLERGALGLMTTHDLALAKAAQALEPQAKNVHFQDELIDGELVFDYQMRSGVVNRSNALELMRSLGLLGEA